MRQTERTILVIWNCSMGTQCKNTEEPGIHRGDFGFTAMQECRGIPQDKPETSVLPILQMGNRLPVKTAS